MFTVNTGMKTDNIPGIDYSVLSQETYESMYKAETLYISSIDDLAVIRFSADKDLVVMKIAETDPAKGDRITPGAFLSLDGKTFKYGVLIPVSEIKICFDDWNQQ